MHLKKTLSNCFAECAEDFRLPAGGQHFLCMLNNRLEKDDARDLMGTKLVYLRLPRCILRVQI